MKNRGYIFDYGGTLDTGGCHWGRMFWHAYRELDVPVSETQFREAYVYAERTLGRTPVISPDFTFRRTLEVKVELQLRALASTDLISPIGPIGPISPIGPIGPISPIAPIVDYLYAAVLRHTAHSREVLRQLDGPKVLVSNFYGNMPTVLREFGLDDLFDAVVESAVVGIRKPDPRIFLLGVEALALQPGEVTVVGDSLEKDIVPAHAAGCRTVWLKGEQWAAGSSGTDVAADAGNADMSLADSIIADLSELIDCPS